MKRRMNEISGITLNAKQMQNLLGGTPVPLSCPSKCKRNGESGECSITSTSNCYCSIGNTSTVGC